MNGQPSGGVYDWYKRGLALLQTGNPAAASQVLGHAHSAEPGSRSIREALARAQFNSRQYNASAETFESLVHEDPADDYAHFGLGLSLARLGEHEIAAGHLAMAAVMRPSVGGYGDALDRVRDTLRVRESLAAEVAEHLAASDGSELPDRVSRQQSDQPVEGVPDVWPDDVSRPDDVSWQAGEPTGTGEHEAGERRTEDGSE